MSFDLISVMAVQIHIYERLLMNFLSFLIFYGSGKLINMFTLIPLCHQLRVITGIHFSRLTSVCYSISSMFFENQYSSSLILKYIKHNLVVDLITLLRCKTSCVSSARFFSFCNLETYASVFLYAFGPDLFEEG